MLRSGKDLKTKKIYIHINAKTKRFGNHRRLMQSHNVKRILVEGYISVMNSSVFHYSGTLQQTLFEM